MEQIELRPVLDGMYSVTRDGRVWSERKQRWMKPSTTNYGYKVVGVVIEGKNRVALVHRLVAAAWVHNAAPDMKTIVNHLNGIKTDNSAANLEWCNHSENNLHAYRSGLKGPSEKQKKAAREHRESVRSFSESHVAEMRNRFLSGEKVASIARHFGIPRTTANGIIHRHNYANVA